MTSDHVESREDAPPPPWLTIHGPLGPPAVGPQQVLHGLQHRVQLLLLPDFRLRDLGHVQLAARQLFYKVKSERQSVRQNWENSEPPG